MKYWISIENRGLGYLKDLRCGNGKIGIRVILKIISVKYVYVFLNGISFE